ncbi:MAG: ATP-dependent helicase [Candidatus Marsarchaeota archaeon]|nr:ATP-dependent helicase [Candidatus Marsarchaeota archaeon]
MQVQGNAFENTLIIANPGTGKTTAIAQRVISLLKSGVKEEDILCITFTNKAASEMRERISNTIKESKIDAKPYLISVHTFHSYAYEYLEGMDVGEGIIGNNALRYSIFRSFQDDNAFNYTTKYIIEEIVPKVENAIRYLKSFGILPESINIKESKDELKRRYNKNALESITIDEIYAFFDYFINAYIRYEKEKDDLEFIDYNDMLLRFLKLYKQKKHYKHVLVDELQDVNGLEAEIALRSGETLFLVGDRKQAIFGFQGGSIKNFKKIEAMRKFKKETKLLNYRSMQPILDYSKKHFLMHVKDSDYKEELLGLYAKRVGSDSKVKIYMAEKQVNASVKILSDIVAKCKQDEKVAVITRTNGQLIELSKILDKKGIEYSTTAGSSTSEEAKSQIIIYLKGLLYDDKASILNALFTPFSGISLREAFEIAEEWSRITKHGNRQSNEVPKEILNMAKNFFKIKERFDVIYSKDLFNNIIMPISVSMGNDYFITAKTINNAILEFSKIDNDKTRDSFFEYLSILEEDYAPIENEKNIVLTTVHKAKGMEFDNVIYVPIGGNIKESFIDMVVYSIIKGSIGLDISEELEDEQIRVDFVAFTRAKNNLYIITNKRNSDRYIIDNMHMDEIESEEEIAPIGGKYDESYALFLNGNYGGSKDILKNKDPWLYSAIKNYFLANHNISYSLLERAEHPYEFLKERILKIESPFNRSLTLGTRAHEIAQMRFNKSLNEKELSTEEKMYLNNIIKIDKEISEKLGFQQIHSEYEITLQINKLIENIDDTSVFKAILDAIYESSSVDGKRYLILDWKTDRTEERESQHRRQLAIYRKALAIHLNVFEANISIAIGFIGLKGNINTNNINCKLSMEQPKAMQIKTFERHLEKFIGYKKDPMLFVLKLLEEKSTDMLHARLLAILNENVKK